MAWVCATCGENHDDIPLSFAADSPDNYFNMTPEARDLRAIIGSDQCVIDEEQFYIRGLLEIPIKDSDEHFLWGVWASMWPEDYDLISDNWDTPDREKKLGPFKARLANSLLQYSPTTFNLKISVVMQPVGQRPLFFVDDSHPLALAQQKGISAENARELAAAVLHNRLFELKN